MGRPKHDTLIYEFHYDYMRPRNGSKVKLCYMDTDSSVYEIETEDFYRDISKDVEGRFGMSRYSKDENRPVPIGKNKKVIALMKDELGGKIMTEFVSLRTKMYAYRKIGKKVEDKSCKDTKMCVVTKPLKTPRPDFPSRKAAYNLFCKDIRKMKKEL